MREGTDQGPVGLRPPEYLSPGETREEYPFEETVRLPTRPARKRRRMRCSKRPVYRRRRRVACLVLVFLAVLAVGGPLFLDGTGQTTDTPPEEAAAPDGEPEAIDPASEGASPKGGEVPGEEEGAAAPNDPTLYLTVPRLGLQDHTVRNDDSEAALDAGAIKLPRTGFPWEAEDTNTYIACHRLGFPGAQSYNQCLDLPSIQKGDPISLEDASGTAYEYRVTESLVVEPEDTWVTDPVAGKDVVSLQTCIEAPDDPHTLGPNWSARFVVRAERIGEGRTDGFEMLAKESAAAYASFLHPASFSYYHDNLSRAAKSAGRHAEVLFPRTVHAWTAPRS